MIGHNLWSVIEEQGMHTSVILCVCEILEYLISLPDFYFLTVASKLKYLKIKFIVFTLQNRVS